MKKLLFAITALLFSSSVLFAAERMIDEKELPKTALTFLASNFAQDKITLVTMDKDFFDKDYKVVLVSGTKVQFDDNGNWTEIECKRNNSVPKAIVPSKIAVFIAAKFPANTIVKIEKDKRFVELELNNGIELKFNSKGDLVEFDD